VRAPSTTAGRLESLLSLVLLWSPCASFSGVVAYWLQAGYAVVLMTGTSCATTVLSVAALRIA